MLTTITRPHGAPKPVEVKATSKHGHQMFVYLFIYLFVRHELDLVVPSVT